MTDDEIKQLQELVDTHDGLHHTLANAVYDTIPWGDVNSPTSEAQNDYLYDKCIEAVEAVLEPARPALAALLREHAAMKAVVEAAQCMVDGVEQAATYVGPHAELVYTFSTSGGDVDKLESALEALAKEQG